jgi:pSer/pThr/pTyr-binding forkhead associated (FHA) protein
MSSGDKEKQQRTMVVQADAKPSAGVDSDSKDTQIKKGQAMAMMKIVEGPGAGTTHALYKGDNAIGRGVRNRVALSFGDETIHRDGHAWISAKDGKFSIELGGKNPVYVNGEKVGGRRAVVPGDLIKIGATTLRLDAV